MRPSPRRLASSLLALFPAVPLAAQVAIAADLSGVRTRSFDSVASLGAASAALSVSLLRPWHSIGASVAWFRPDGGTALVQGAAAGSVFSGPVAGRLRGEAALSGSVVGGGATPRTGRVAPAARLHVLGTRAGGWIGGSVGAARRAAAWRGVRQGEAAAWLREGNASLTVLAQPTAVGDSVRFTDLGATARWVDDRFDLAAGVGLRTQGGTTTSSYSLAGTAWLTPHVAVVLTGGRVVEDPVQGFAGGRYLTAGLRLATRRPDRVAATPTLPVPSLPTLPVADGAALRLRLVDTTTIELVVEAPTAVRVELQGDVTDWQPVALEPDGRGRFVRRLRRAAGAMQLVVRLDGGAWVVPRGTTPTRDDFDAVVGLLVVP